jgi:probable F420-dependent oxidoreductase
MVQIGLALAQYGAFTNLRSIQRVAREAEALGFDSLWVGDRLLVPLEPSDRYPGGDGTIPQAHRTFLDPFAVLTVAAALTERVRLGSSTLNAPWYPPALLARSLTTIDRLSGGRLCVGLGLGWSSDEYAAVGASWHGRGARLDACLDALETIWADDPVSHAADDWTIVPSHIHPKPVQQPRPPLYLAGFAPTALERIGRRADGWLATGMPVAALTGFWDTIRRAAQGAGRDPGSLRIIQRLNPIVTDTAGPADLAHRTGTVDQISAYAESAARAGVHEIILDLQHTARDDDHLMALATRFLTALRPEL